MGAETSPVKAPSLLQETFWPEMAILVFFAASTAVEMAVNGGPMTMSQCLEFATSGAKVEKNARVSARVLYIFQLPAITRRRMNTSKRSGRKKNITQRCGERRGLRGKNRVHLFVGERFDAGELAAAEKF